MLNYPHNVTIEHFTWVTHEHPDAAQLKLTPHATWSKLITTQYGIDIPIHDIYNPRLAEGKLTVSIRRKNTVSDDYHKLSGTYDIFSNLKNRTDERQPVTMIWLKGNLNDIIDKAKKQHGYEGIVPSTSSNSFGVRIDSTVIEEARRALVDISKFHPSNTSTSHRLTYETKGWPKTTDPHAAIEAFHTWGWSALIISKRDSGQRSTFIIGAQTPTIRCFVS